MSQYDLRSLEVVLPLLDAGTGQANLLSRTVRSLEGLRAAGIKVALVLVGTVDSRLAAARWLMDNAAGFEVRDLEFTWVDGWSALHVADYVKTPFFAVLMVGERFIWPQGVPLDTARCGALYFDHPSPDENGRLAFWTAGNLAPLKFGPLLSSPIWNAQLCERARVMLERLEQLRPMPQFEPWQAYLAVNEERLAGVHRIVQL